MSIIRKNGRKNGSETRKILKRNLNRVAWPVCVLCWQNYDELIGVEFSGPIATKSCRVNHVIRIEMQILLSSFARTTSLRQKLSFPPVARHVPNQNGTEIQRKIAVWTSSPAVLRRKVSVLPFCLIPPSRKPLCRIMWLVKLIFLPSSKESTKQRQ